MRGVWWIRKSRVPRSRVVMVAMVPWRKEGAMRALFIIGTLVLMGIVLVSPAVADRGGHWGGHFGGGHFNHFGHPRVFIGGYFGYPYYSYPYWYSPYPYAYPYP